MKKWIHDSLVIIPNAVTPEEERALLEIIKDVEWQDLPGKWNVLKNRRFGWGDHAVDKRNRPVIPNNIMTIGDKLRQFYEPMVPDLPEKMSSCTANKYPVGEGLGLHNDGKAWLPFVIGLTLNSARHMEFTNPSTKERIIVETPRRSSYCFFSEAYVEWYHASVKGNSKGGKYYQYDTAYSLTWRTPNENYNGDSWEYRQSLNVR